MSLTPHGLPGGYDARTISIIDQRVRESKTMVVASGTCQYREPNTNRAQVILDPGPGASWAKVSASVVCTAGDRVTLVYTGDWVIVAAFRENPLINQDLYSAPSAPDTMAVDSYTDWPGSPTKTFRKLRTTSLLEVDLRSGGFVSVANNLLHYGVNISGTDTAGNTITATDYDVGRHYYHQANIHASWGSAVPIAGIPAGVLTIVPRWRRATVGSTATFQMNSVNWVTFKVSEVAPPLTI